MKMVCSVYVMMEDINYENEGPNCIFFVFLYLFYSKCCESGVAEKRQLEKDRT